MRGPAAIRKAWSACRWANASLRQAASGSSPVSRSGPER